MCKWHFNFERVLYIGWGFTLLDVAFITAQGLTSKVLHDNDFKVLGYVAIATIYLTYSVFSFFSKPVVDCLGNRFSLSIGCFFEAFHLVALVFPALRKEGVTWLQGDAAYNWICAMIIICAFIAGVGTSLLWVAHGRYVTLCADDTNKGYFNSVFWVFMMACQVIGNILGGTIITKVKQSTFFTGFTILACIAAVWMLGLPTPKPYPADEETELVKVEEKKEAVADPEKAEAEVIPGEQAAETEDPKANIIQLDEKKADGAEEPKVHPFVEMFHFLKTPRFMTFAPIIFFAGISMAVYAGLLIPMLARSMGPDVDDSEKTSQACFAMIGIGAGEIIGSLVNGKLNDYFGISKYLIICYTELVIAFIFLFIYNTQDCFSMWFAALSMFWWGVQDAGITNFFLCVVGFQFGKGSTTPFSALRFVQAFAIGSFTLIESLIKTVTQHNIYFAVLFAFSTFAWWLFYFKFDLIEVPKKAAGTAVEKVQQDPAADNKSAVTEQVSAAQ